MSATLPAVTWAPERTGRTPFGRIVLVELRKMVTTRSGFWLLASMAIAALVTSLGVIAFADQGPLPQSLFLTATAFPINILVPIVAILSVTSEWTQRTGLTTFTLVPQRSRVIAAKGLATVVVAAAASLVQFGIGALGTVLGSVVRNTAPVWDVGAIHAAYSVLGTVLSLAIGFMVGTLIRVSTAAMAVYFVLTFVLPIVFGVLADAQAWFRDLRPWVDHQFAQEGLVFFGGALTTAQWQHLALTTVVWLIAPLLVGLTRAVRTDIS